MIGADTRTNVEAATAACANDLPILVVVVVVVMIVIGGIVMMVVSGVDVDVSSTFRDGYNSLATITNNPGAIERVALFSSDNFKPSF